MNRYILLLITLGLPLFGNESDLLSSAPSLVEGAKLAFTHKAKEGYLTTLAYRTNQPVKIFLDAIANKLGNGLEMETGSSELKSFDKLLIKDGMAVEYSSIFRYKSNDIRTVYLLYIKMDAGDGYSHTVKVDVRTLPPELEEAFRKTQATEPNQALEPTTLSVTPCAPSRTNRAS